MPGTAHAHRRGIAMLLVLISLAMATILAVSYLASRDNSAAIGQNVTASASARWAAISGIELGVAILETESDWRTAHTEGKLLDDYDLDGVLLDLDLIDIETGEPPTIYSQHIKLIATAVVNGVEQEATAIAEVSGTDDGVSVNVDLSEFAVFATEKITLENRATITRWPVSPLAALGKRVHLGTQGFSASTVELKGDSASIDTTVYAPPSASTSLVTNDSGPAIDVVELQDTIPMPAAPNTGVVPPSPDDTYPVNDRSGGYIQVTSDVRVASASLVNSAVSHWIGDITVTCNHNFQLDSGSTILVEGGDATFIVFEDLILDNGAAIILQPDATLTIFVGDDLNIKDSYIGNVSSENPLRDNTGTASWIDPERVRIYSIPPDTDVPSWDLHGNTVTKASIYGPDVDLLQVRNTSAHYGRVAVQSILVKDDGAIFYDHILDRGGGFTNPASPLFDTDGRIKNDFLSLGSLNASVLQTLADALNIPIVIDGQTFTVDTGGETPEPTLPGEPTPRPVPVAYEMEDFGTDMEQWEQAVANASGS
jgi:hypothetical protein